MNVAVRRRSSSRDEEPEEREERPTRRRSRDDDDDREERGSRRSRSRDRDDEPEEERPSRGRRSRDEDEDDRPSRGRGRRSSRDDEDEKPSRRRSRGRSEDEGGRSRRRGTSGFGAYSSKKVSTGGSFADEFKPGENKKVLIKILDAEPFDSYNQHWIDDMPKGERKSYVCLDDEEYFGSTECPLCDIGEKQKTYALFNIVDLSNPRKPEVKVWSASPAVADFLERAAEEKRTSPINRDDLYWEVELQRKGKKYQWVLTPIKARDLPGDFELDPLEEDEIEEFENDLFDDRSAVTKVDSFDDLQALADDLVN